MHSARIRSLLAQMTPDEKLGQLQIIFRPSLDEAASLVRQGIGSMFWPQSAAASNAAATPSSGPAAAAARCQAQGTGSSSGSHAAARARCTCRRWTAVAEW